MTMMAGKVAKFGFFSPAVIVAKVLLGEQKLNKVRVCVDGEEGREGRRGSVLERRGWVGKAMMSLQAGRTTLLW